MIQTVEKLCHSQYHYNDEYCRILDEMKERGELYEKVPDNLKDAFWRFWDCQSEGAIDNLIEYLNFKSGKKQFAFISELRHFYLIKINGFALEVEFINAYIGGGDEENKIRVAPLDSRGSDEFWVEVAEELYNAANGKLRNIDGFHPDEWYMYESKNR